MRVVRSFCWGLVLALPALSCSPAPKEVSCGADTVALSGACVAAPDCGAGTHLVGLRCVLNTVDGGLGCGVGTHVEDRLCVPDQPDGGLAGTTSWNANVRVAPPEFAWTGEPEMAVDSRGRIFVATMSNRSGYNADSVTLFRSTDLGQSFQVLGEEHPGTGQFLGDTTVVVDGADRLFWGWTVYDSGQNGGIEVVLSTDGNVLGPPQRVSDVDPAHSFCDRPWLSVNPFDGSTYVSWTNGADDGVQGARYTQSIGGQPFASPQQNIADPNPSLSLFEESPLAFDASGAPVVGATLYIAASRAFSTDVMRKAGGVFVPTQVSLLANSPALMVDRYLNLRSDGAGHLTLAYLDVSSRRVGVYTAHSADGTSWSTASNINEGSEASNAALPWLTTDAQNRVHALWLDNRSGGWVPYTAISSDGMSFSQVERIGDAQFVEDGSLQRWIGDFNSIVTRDGTRYAVWTDTREGFSQVYFSSAPNPP